MLRMLLLMLMLMSRIPSLIAMVPEEPEPEIEQSIPEYDSTSEYVSYEDGVLTAYKGVNWYNGHKETYYNLDMSGIIYRAKNEWGLEGEYWIREDGAKMFGEYVIVAANLSVHPRCSLVETSLGTGIVLDTGGFAEWNAEQIDIATSW